MSQQQINDVKSFLNEYSNLKCVYDEAQEALIKRSEVQNDKYIRCLQLTNKLITFLDKQNPFVLHRHKEEVKNTYYISSELLVRTVGIHNQRPKGFTDHEKNTLFMAIAHARKCLSVDPLFQKAMDILKIVLVCLTMYSPNVEENILLLKQILMVDPSDFQVQYNLGFMYQRANNLDESLQHYKLALGIINLQLQYVTDSHLKNTLNQFKIKCLNGLGSIYYTIQDRDLALYFFNLAYDIDPEDPDINNQIAVVNTELRFTDKAIEHYQKGIANYQKSQMSVDKEMLAASLHMNMGLAKSYECDLVGAIECYNNALKYKPKLSLAYQNKLLDSNYISHLIEDPMYLAKLHKNLNKIYDVVIDDYKKSCPSYNPKKDIIKGLSKNQLVQKNVKLNIGFVSGDFICHPVSYFISNILKNINFDLFNVHCYSVKVVELKDMFPKCKWHVVKNTSPEKLKAMIQSHNIDILFDLSAHTGDNRLDTFVLKPAPIQISYCGYPGSSGIRSMDYRLTDKYCDGPQSEKYYQEKLVYMKNCFLSYTPSTGLDGLPDIGEQPCVKNGYITFGTFNRYNKINEMVIRVWEKLLKAVPTARFVIKTKEFQTERLKQQFLDSFTDKSILERITILPYSDTYIDHLPDYNLMDIALDTFPYSGTTTSCEALAMGTPILTLYDNVRHYHSQNVTSSLLINSGLDEYIAYSQDEYIQKAVEFANNLNKLKDLKTHVRDKFLQGHVCNHIEFVNDFENTVLEIYKNHSW